MGAPGRIAALEVLRTARPGASTVRGPVAAAS
jgi:hypothetical protein